MSNNPHVTLLIPIYGTAPFLKSTLKSVDEIIFPSIECLFILDRPSESIRSIVKEYCATHPNALTIESHNPGISAALNTGLAKSKGTLIARLDSDDIITPERIERQVSKFKENPKLVLVGTQMRIIDSKNHHISCTSYPQKNKKIKKLMEVRNCIGHPSVLYLKSAVQEAGLYRGEFNGAEDLDLWMRISHFGDFAIIDECLTFYRISENQETNKLKSSKGSLEERVLLANWTAELSLRHKPLKHLGIKVNLKEDSYKISIIAFLKLYSIRNLWKAESNYNTNRVLMFKCLLKSLLFFPPTFFLYINYVLSIKFKNGVAPWK